MEKKKKNTEETFRDTGVGSEFLDKILKVQIT